MPPFEVQVAETLTTLRGMEGLAGVQRATRDVQAALAAYLADPDAGQRVPGGTSLATLVIKLTVAIGALGRDAHPDHAPALAALERLRERVYQEAEGLQAHPPAATRGRRARARGPGGGAAR